MFYSLPSSRGHRYLQIYLDTISAKKKKREYLRRLIFWNLKTEHTLNFNRGDLVYIVYTEGAQQEPEHTHNISQIGQVARFQARYSLYNTFRFHLQILSKHLLNLISIFTKARGRRARVIKAILAYRKRDSATLLSAPHRWGRRKKTHAKLLIDAACDLQILKKIGKCFVIKIDISNNVVPFFCFSTPFAFMTVYIIWQVKLQKNVMCI